MNVKRILEELWNGQIAPGPNCGVGNPEMEQLCVLLERNREELELVMSKEQMEILRTYADNVEEFQYLQRVQAFSDGFSLATRLMVEAFAGDGA